MRTRFLSDFQRGGADGRLAAPPIWSALMPARPGPASGRRWTSWTGRAWRFSIHGSPRPREGVTIVSLGFRDAAEGEVSEDVAHRANIWFRRYADSNRDMRITDEEIRVALVQAATALRALAAPD